MNQDKVSVIIPTYKRSKFLCRAIESVLNQTYNNIEIIIVDDNGIDSEYCKINERKIEKYLNNEKIKYLKHEKNMNGAAARNTGIKNSTGEFITFLDDDDIYLPTRIEKMVKELKENNQYDGCYSSVAFSYYGNVYDILETKGSGDFQLQVLKMENIIGTGSNLFFRKKTVEKIGEFDENFLRNQDIEYLIRFFEYGKIKEIKEILVIKCKEDNFNLSTNVPLMYNTKELFFKKFSNIISKYPNELNKIYINNYFPIYINSYKERKFYKYIPKIKIILDEHGYKEKKTICIKKKIFKILDIRLINFLYNTKMKLKVFKNKKKYKLINKYGGE